MSSWQIGALEEQVHMGRRGRGIRIVEESLSNLVIPLGL